MTTMTATKAPKIVPRLCEGGTVVCLATGPSLTESDVQYVRGKATVIAVNDAHRLAPWADVLFSADRAWWPHYKGVPSFNGLKYGVGSHIGKRNPFQTLPHLQVLRNTGHDGLETDPGGIRTGHNSGYGAINIAVHLGATRIVLLGYNMGGGTNGKLHFFGDHPPGLNQNPGLYPSFRRRYETLVEPLKALGVEVLNCTENTSLMAFPRRCLREVIS